MIKSKQIEEKYLLQEYEVGLKYNNHPHKYSIKRRVIIISSKSDLDKKSRAM